MTWQLVILGALILFSILYAQEKHYEFLNQQVERDIQKQIEKEVILDSKLSNILKEFDEYKRKVDTLTLKAGFKL